MGPSKHFKTLPQTFRILVDDYGKDPSKVMLKHKVDKLYVDITYQQFKRMLNSPLMVSSPLELKRVIKL